MSLSPIIIRFHALPQLGRLKLEADISLPNGQYLSCSRCAMPASECDTYDTMPNGMNCLRGEYHYVSADQYITGGDQA
ncbi:hypothetical protein [Deefgea piscis]|uniref:hypothetical protein n=1 Tax=Deefgea piscis TaxID=2739061 RepID=UPI001C810E90|nr:hypothetical protein [Deefgea piscis]QZA80268.1 hypothetical protein K4H25_12070 [Deefgea piscis]